MDDSSSYKDIKEVLLKQFGGSASNLRAMEAFQDWQRGEKETLRELVFTLKTLYMRARPDDPSAIRDREVKFKLLQLLDSNTREALLKDSDLDSADLETVINRASRLEQVASSGRNSGRSSSLAGIAVVDDRLERLEQRLEALAAAVSGGSRANNRSGNARNRNDLNSAQRTCYNCGVHGHFMRNCPNRAKRCFKCRGFGHTHINCPIKRTSSGNF